MRGADMRAKARGAMQWGICHTAGDMRAERAEMGTMGIWREESSAEYGGGICALSRAERERGYIETKKTTSYPSRRKPLFPIRWDDAPGILLFLINFVNKCSLCFPRVRTCFYCTHTCAYSSRSREKACKDTTNFSYSQIF